MSSLDGAVGEITNEAEIASKLEDVKEDTGALNDIELHEKPASEDGEEQPQDDEMDLFGEEEVAEEVKHEDTLAAYRLLAQYRADRDPYSQGVDPCVI